MWRSRTGVENFRRVPLSRTRNPVQNFLQLREFPSTAVSRLRLLKSDGPTFFLLIVGAPWMLQRLNKLKGVPDVAVIPLNRDFDVGVFDAVFTQEIRHANSTLFVVSIRPPLTGNQ